MKISKNCETRISLCKISFQAAPITGCLIPEWALLLSSVSSVARVSRRQSYTLTAVIKVRWISYERGFSGAYEGAVMTNALNVSCQNLWSTAHPFFPPSPSSVICNCVLMLSLLQPEMTDKHPDRVFVPNKYLVWGGAGVVTRAGSRLLYLSRQVWSNHLRALVSSASCLRRDECAAD